jgi:hypothetical protein
MRYNAERQSSGLIGESAPVGFVGWRVPFGEMAAVLAPCRLLPCIDSDHNNVGMGVVVIANPVF